MENSGELVRLIGSFGLFAEEMERNLTAKFSRKMLIKLDNL